MDSNASRYRQLLKYANQAEILRSHQRDEEFIKYLKEKILDILHNFGNRKILFHMTRSDGFINLLYFVFTTAMGNQTLGEEYTGIVQADAEARKVPTLTARILSVMFECFGQGVLMRLLKKLQASVNNPYSELTPTARNLLNHLLSVLISVIPISILIHKGLFYIYGRYYTLGKRTTGIDYVKVYGSRPTDAVSWALKLLGIATLIQCGFKIWQDRLIEKKSNIEEIEDGRKVCRVCQLCLEAVPTTATPCGHLFCWNCLCDWLRSKTQCPFCREYVAPSRVVYLMNL